jgi:hypothetical protein
MFEIRRRRRRSFISLIAASQFVFHKAMPGKVGVTAPGRGTQIAFDHWR